MRQLASVLLVEDDEMIQALLRLYLETEGFFVVTAADGAQALELVETVNPDVIILDIMLPVVNGYEAYRQIRRSRSTPVIMMSAGDIRNEYFQDNQPQRPIFCKNHLVPRKWWLKLRPAFKFFQPPLPLNSLPGRIVLWPCPDQHKKFSRPRKGSAKSPAPDHQRPALLRSCWPEYFRSWLFPSSGRR
ncbi:MAG: response regulator [Desulfotomaculales bacterium]